MNKELLKEMKPYIEKATAHFNINDMFRQALKATRIDMDTAEQRQFFEKYIKTMQMKIDSNGNRSMNECKEQINRILSMVCGKSVDKINKITMKDRFFDALQAIDFGLTDDIADFNLLISLDCLGPQESADREVYSHF